MKYEIVVTRKSIYETLVQVEASSEEEAIEKAEEFSSRFRVETSWLKAGSDIISGEAAKGEDHKWLGSTLTAI